MSGATRTRQTHTSRYRGRVVLIVVLVCVYSTETAVDRAGLHPHATIPIPLPKRMILRLCGVFCLAVYSNAARALRSARCGLLDGRAGRWAHGAMVSSGICHPWWQICGARCLTPSSGAAASPMWCSRCRWPFACAVSSRSRPARPLIHSHSLDGRTGARFMYGCTGSAAPAGP